MRLLSTSSMLRRAQVSLLAGAVALALAGCAVGPQYQRPASTLPPAFHYGGNGTGAPLALDAWWTQFDDPVLTAIIGKAMTQNLDLAAALARVDQARAVAHLSRAAQLPVVAADAGIALQRQSLDSPLGKLASHQPGYERAATLASDGVGASWELDLAGGLQRGANADAAEAQAAEADRLGVRVSIAAEAADSYLRIRGAQARIALAQQELDADRQSLSLVEQRLAEGMATRREQAQAQARVAHIDASVPPLRTELAVQLNRLDVLMGVQPGTYEDGLTAPATTTSTPRLDGALTPSDLLRRRPDVIAAERRLAASNERIGQAMAAYYPSLSISALLGFESLHSVLPSAASFQPQAVAGLRWRLFDFGRIDAEVARATGANAEALARYRQAMLRATEDVENALATQAQLDAEQRALRVEVDAASRARAATLEAFEGGAVSLAETLEQDRQLLAARDRLARADTDANRAAVATFRALGGGW